MALPDDFSQSGSRSKVVTCQNEVWCINQSPSQVTGREIVRIMKKVILILAVAAICSPLFVSQAQAQATQDSGHKRHHHCHHHCKHHKPA
jgi:hypothetical protein